MHIVDLGGSLAVASRGLFATGVSTDLNGKQLATECCELIVLDLMLIQFVSNSHLSQLWRQDR